VPRFDRPRLRETRLQRAERLADAYGLVLVLILVTFVVMMTLPPEGWAGRFTAVVVACLTAVVALTSSNVASARVRVAVVASIVAIACSALAKLLDSQPVLGAAFAIATILLAVAAGTILRRVLRSERVEFRTILGAVSVFTLLGLLFGFAFAALGRLKGGSVFVGGGAERTSDYMFFSYTTLTTTGYGNLVPAGQIGQSLAVFEMLVGQIFLVTLVAGLVSLWRPGSGRDGDVTET